MNELGVLHIVFTIIAYSLYFLVLLKYFSKSYPFRLLQSCNVLYILGFVLGMLWANLEWGYMLSLDSKIVISMLVPIPFLVEAFLKKKDWRLPALGCLLIVLDYVIPFLLSTVHVH